MAKVIRRQWQADLGSGLPRKDRRSCAYEAYVPDPLVGRPLTLDGDVAADVADAERAVTELDVAASAPVDTEALARLLLRAESVASSKIEGLEIGGRRLLRAEAARDLGEEPSDVTAAEVLGNIAAMARAIQSVEESSGTIALDHMPARSVRNRTGSAGATTIPAPPPSSRLRRRWSPLCSTI